MRGRSLVERAHQLARVHAVEKLSTREDAEKVWRVFARREPSIQREQRVRRQITPAQEIDAVGSRREAGACRWMFGEKTPRHPRAFHDFARFDLERVLRRRLDVPKVRIPRELPPHTRLA